MSDYHGLDVTAKLNQIRIAIHSPTPAGNNDVGYSYALAVKEARTSTAPDGITQIPPTSIVPWLEATNPTEYSEIQNGTIVETVENVEFDANASNAAKVQVMNAYVAARIPEITQEVTHRLEFWGADRNLP